MGAMKAVVIAASVVVLGASTVSAEETLRVGFVTTLSGGGALLGEELQRGWDIGLAALGGKIGGLPTEISVVDDQAKPDVALTGIDKLINETKVQVIAGVVWGNVMTAIYEPVVRSKTALLVTNSAVNIAAGKDCSPYYISTSFETDSATKATATLVNADGMKTTFLLAPNYQVGKDIHNELRKDYDGKVVGETLFKLGQTDFESELSEIRAAQPQSVVAFAPGAMGIALMKQAQALGLTKSTHFYPVNIVDELTLPALGDSVVGTEFVSPYDGTQDIPANRQFVAAFEAKYHRPPTQYAAQTYDGVMLLDAGVRGLDGKVDDPKALVAEMHKAKFQSVRGPLRFNVNGYPIQNMYKLEVVTGPDGKPKIQGAGIVVKDQSDAYAKDCPLTW
jgi:branched-chain amino acid transport system substrate-binding protein